MIKVTLISLIGIGGVSLNADHLIPKSVELNAGAIVTVSYTHLTLPTIYSV